MTILEKASNFTMIVVGIAIVGDIGVRHFRPLGMQPAVEAPPRPAIYKPGEAFPMIDGFRQEPGKPALLLVVKSTCRYCTQSLPFYRELVQQARASGAPVQLVGICLESPAACEEYFKSNQITLDATVGAPRGVPRIPGTPALVMLDGAGKVSALWMGALRGDAEKAVLSAVTKARS